MSVLMYHDQAITGFQGPQGPDGNPIGTVISYMGIAAPKDYLICDGAIYNIADYSDLAKHIQTNFGLTNFFGGDGTTTFAVPDMRNLFLRGYHGENGEQLSGSIGEKQEATEIPNVAYAHIGNGSGSLAIFQDTNSNNPVKNYDSMSNAAEYIKRSKVDDSSPMTEAFFN